VNYRVDIIPSAEKDLDKLPSRVHDRISARILSLEENPRQTGTKKLSGREQYRLRVGDYRVLYTIDDASKSVRVVGVAHRREAYR